MPINNERGEKIVGGKYTTRDVNGMEGGGYPLVPRETAMG